MRIISGRYKGRRIQPPVSLPVRPTTDYAKEGLFNVLNNLVDYSETAVLDLFAGTGNIAFEFTSRGCPSVLAVDIERRCVEYVNQTAEKLNMKGVRAIRMNVMVLLKSKSFESTDLLFADPPYDMEGIETMPDMIRQSGIVKPTGIFIIEHSDRYDFSADPSFYQLRKYGKVHFSFFCGKQVEQEEESAV